MLLKSYSSVHRISQPYKFALSSGGFLNFGCSLFLFSIINDIIFVLKIINVKRMSAGSPLEELSFECTFDQILLEKYKYIFETNLSWLLTIHIV